MRENPALVQYHEVIAGDDLVEQMGGPQHADALFGDQLADMAEDIGARLDVEADRRLVKQQQRFAGLKADVVAEDTDASGLDAEQPRNQREQRALAGAVEAKQRREACRRDGEVDVDEGASDAIGMADAIDRQRGHFGRTAAAVTVRRSLSGEGRVGCGHGCAIAMPQGSSPTWIVLITFCATTSMIETSLDTPLVTSRYFSSGVNAMCQTRCPTRRYLVT